jgi:hypothetical protein
MPESVERARPGEEQAEAAQRHLALQRANRVRAARAELKRRLRSGELDAREAILHQSHATETMAVAELLLCQRGWGPARSMELLRSVALPERKTVGSLTERQRAMLAAVLSGGNAKVMPLS